MGVKSLIQRVMPSKPKDKGIDIMGDQKYDYSTKESREITVPFLYSYAKAQKEPHTLKLKLYDDYYENEHQTQKEIQDFCKENNLPFIPAVVPDAYIHVESQIIPELPDFEFNGRDDDLDNVKAKQREYVVRYVLDQNRVADMNPDNERQLNKLGNAFWKVAYDYGISGPGFQGDIIIGAPDCAEIFPDPAAIDIDDCEYIDYSYRMHRLKVYRKFKADLDRLGITLSELSADGNFADTQIYNSQFQDINVDTLQVIEHWFRQPLDGSDTMEITFQDPLTGKDKTITKTVEWKAGDIACSVIIGTKEIKYFPMYWMKTGRQNKKYPFVKYCKIPTAKSFWDKSEIEPIKDLIDAADRELSSMLLNDAFHANDITIMEENALADDTEADNRSGAIWLVKQGMIEKVKRLGGLANLNGGLKDTVNFIRDIIKQTVGNFDVNMGDAPPANVRTLGGLVELKDQGNKRQNIKKADRKNGFERLYELIDWTALEFYDDNRLIFIGAEGDSQPDEEQQQTQPGQQGQQLPQQGQPDQQMPGQNMDRKKGPVIFKFNSDNLKVLDAQATDQTGDAQYYYPRVDAKIDVGDGVTNNRAMTLQATENIAGMNITPENYKLVCSMVDIMMLPDRKEIKQYLNDFFQQQKQSAQGTNSKPISVTVKENLTGGVREYDATANDVQTVADVLKQMQQIAMQQQPQIPGQLPQMGQPQQPQGGLPPELQQAISNYPPEMQQIMSQLSPEELQQFISKTPSIAGGQVNQGSTPDISSYPPQMQEIMKTLSPEELQLFISKTSSMMGGGNIG